MHRKNLFRRTRLERFVGWMQGRGPWLWFIVGSVAVLAISHFVFQRWFLMPPCEECVYIRFAFFALAVGALIPLLTPRFFVMRLLGYIAGFAASAYGIFHALTLMAIHSALRSSDPTALFGVKMCSLTPAFPFELPFDAYLPALFKPEGPCGADVPVVPPETVLGDWQASVIAQIQDAGGWYLFPWWQTGSMAECALVIFALVFLWLLSAVLLEGFAKRF